MTNEVKLIDKLNHKRLKIKAKSLAAESRIIREMEMKLHKEASKLRLQQKHKLVSHKESMIADLQNHRHFVVRREARATNLARGFIKGLAYKQIERTTKGLDFDTIDRVTTMAQKYKSRSITKDQVKEWINKE